MYRSYYLKKKYLQFKNIYLYNLNIIMFTRVRLGLCLILEKKSPFSKILICMLRADVLLLKGQFTQKWKLACVLLTLEAS